jgi:hypothetical protein
MRKDAMSKAAAALGKKGGSVKSEAKTASSRENGKKGGRPATDAFNEMFPVGQDFHTGKWGWRRVNGCLDLSRCVFGSKSSASRDRNQSNEKALFERTGEVCIST